jgi:valyl-tRNA synthetase
MFVSLEDLLTRFWRMRGRAALWVPGADHAGIATQLQVEKQLREEGTSRAEVGREEFLRRAWGWKREKAGRIEQQIRRLGASCDWDRFRFTLDEDLQRAVREAFVTLYEQGLIYKGTYLVNWSPGLQTAVSDLEVERTEEQGTLYHFRYPLQDGGFMPVATTRPETILGDTAVAVHPEDERFAEYIGKTARVPMLERPIPIIADERVEREFGTGALKITPGHDPTDYEIGQDHGLEMINIMNKDATLNANAGPYAGLDRFEAREKLWADMKEAGLVIKEEAHTHVVPRSQRGGEIVEPLLSEQWFVKIQPLAEKAIAAVRDGRIKIVPEHFERVYFNWMENIIDWCISRQLWWGHQIPVWTCDDGHTFAAREDPTECPECGSAALTQDPDVLDTWFSSGLWPFSIFGWPEKTADLARFYPTDVLETGYDILFFWVARMIMMGLWFMDEIPFHTVYLHGLVRDENGVKMSKTYGNVVDPIETMDAFSTDALRFTLLTGSTPGNDMNLALSRVEANRNFGNKLWQAARFITANLEGAEPIGPPDTEGLTLPERWILSRLQSVIANVTRLIEGYLFGEAGRQLYDFFWGEFADWFIEMSKASLYGDDEAAKSRTRRALVYAMDTILRLLHPYIPFVTEEIYRYIPHTADALMIAPWPEPIDALRDEAAEVAFDQIAELIRGIRNARNEYNVQPGQRIAAVFDGGGDLIDAHRDIFERLAGVDAITFLEGESPEQAAAIVVGEITCYLPLAGMVDLDAERERLRGELENIEGQIARGEKMLANENFVNKAKPEVVQRERERLADFKARREATLARLDALK